MIIRKSEREIEIFLREPTPGIHQIPPEQRHGDIAAAERRVPDAKKDSSQLPHSRPRFWVGQASMVTRTYALHG